MANEYTEYMQRRVIQLSLQYPAASVESRTMRAHGEWFSQQHPATHAPALSPPQPQTPEEQQDYFVTACAKLFLATNGGATVPPILMNQFSDEVTGNPLACLIAAVQLGYLSMVQHLLPRFRPETMPVGRHPIILALTYNQPEIFRAVMDLPLSPFGYQDLFELLILRDSANRIPEFYERYVTVEPNVNFRYESIGHAMQMALDTGRRAILPLFDRFVLDSEFGRLMRADIGLDDVADYAVQRREQLAAGAAGTAIRRPASPTSPGSPASPPRQYARYGD